MIADGLQASQQIGAMQEEIKDIEDKANTDSPAHFSNRRRFDSFPTQALLDASVSRQYLPKIICNVDHYKMLNDK